MQRVGGDLRVVLNNQPRSAAAATLAPTAPVRETSARVADGVSGQAVAKKPNAEHAAEPAAAKHDKPPPKSAERWRYRDPKGVVRDCTFPELLQWSKAGYFAAGVPVQRASASAGPAEWITLGAALKEMAPKPQAATTQPAHDTSTPDPALEDAAPSTDCGWDDNAIRAARALFGKADTMWVYKDTEGNEQGPFSGSDMLGWLLDGYMHDHQLPVAQATSDGTRAFKALEQWLR